MDLSTNIANFSFKNPLMNASGALCTSYDELNALLGGSNSSLVTKSATPLYREGNPMPRYAETPLGTINSMGLANQGFDFYLNFIENNYHQKPLFLSIAGLCLEDNLAMAKKAHESKAEFLLELNLSCPNIMGKPQTGYDFQRTREVLEQVFEIYTDKPLGVKLPPYFDMVHFEQMAEILKQFPLSFVTCINSIGNGLYIDAQTESVVIKPKDGFGGLGGEYVKPTALANVRKFYELLPKSIKIIGCGGILSGKDVFEHLLCGASMVQVGSQLMKEKNQIFSRLEKELEEIMYKKNYSKIEDFKGNLKSL
ncbi:Dihydroorotate dehydrogenase A (fumarate) [Candidatus Ornithobacterium hominis]|uniref:Dihydroorotate dehydrogenase n=1 Tax=Candidatus Ornithobacterium hominis TaxID=2497989 RepID=A0A383TTS7_9FLAO|nr:dihydroorotate oxidase [Candidatus Ornithobacterium hominis]MCT7903739.1 dihydroorotate oxidase [Candidatus Ornithobacterium hominis]SZD71082.1 Dihydroorotate dehydrogenase A (fumarate) [Candidatus Ornithobacterium hominis]SZD71755.1 Dihydroorotate dehydrogenase A (fumarate) [Candidatus Ornithobacterium hominis]